MADLVGGRWPQYAAIDRILGSPSNVYQSNVAARSNVYYTGINKLIDQETAATKKGIVVAIPVELGDVISKVTVLLGSKPVETTVESFVALYGGASKPKGKGALLAQSKVAKATIPASKAYTAELESKVTITPTNAPFGYVYAGLVAEYGAAENATLVGFARKTATQYEWFTGAPEAWSVELEQASAGKAPSELTIEGKAIEATPLVFIT